MIEFGACTRISLRAKETSMPSFRQKGHKLPKIKWALISVSDKGGLENLVKGLSIHGIEIISTGGTAGFILSLGIKEEVTGFPEMSGGTVK